MIKENAQHHHHGSSSLSDFILGAQDGLVSVLGLVLGLVGKRVRRNQRVERHDRVVRTREKERGIAAIFVQGGIGETGIVQHLHSQRRQGIHRRLGPVGHPRLRDHPRIDLINDLRHFQPWVQHLGTAGCGGIRRVDFHAPLVKIPVGRLGIGRRHRGREQRVEIGLLGIVDDPLGDFRGHRGVDGFAELRHARRQQPHERHERKGDHANGQHDFNEGESAFPRWRQARQGWGGGETHGKNEFTL